MHLTMTISSIALFVFRPRKHPFALAYQTTAQAQTGDAWQQLLRNLPTNKFIQQLLAPSTAVWVDLAEPKQTMKSIFLMRI
jgi:hypothetical protein